jgi:tryptophanase
MGKEQFIAEPYKIKVIEPITLLSREEREKRIKAAYYNMHYLKSEDVYIDFETDSGTSAMSDKQWSAMMIGDESYAGAKSFYHLKEAVEEVLGFKYVVPTHQGRPAENVLFPTLINQGDIIPFNMAFDTERVSIPRCGGKVVDCAVDIAYDPKAIQPFKGNIDIGKLQFLIDEVGADRIPFIMLTISNNSGGGQPVSMENIKAARKLADKYNIRLLFDAARSAENAYFIQQREEGYHDKTIAKIYKEQFSHADGCVFSCKKDPLVNIGGFIGLNDEELYWKTLPLLVQMEGFITYGGMTGRDMEALAQGLREMIDDDYIASRVRQTQYLGEKLDSMGIDIMKPVGGSAVYIDAASFLPHLPRSQFPANALTSAIYVECGVRTLGFGALVFTTTDEKTGEPIYPELELCRLAIPRRVYTNLHMDFVAEGIKRVYENRDKVRGHKIIYLPPGIPENMRHFLAWFELV